MFNSAKCIFYIFFVIPPPPIYLFYPIKGSTVNQLFVGSTSCLGPWGHLDPLNHANSHSVPVGDWTDSVHSGVRRELRVGVRCQMWAVSSTCRWAEVANCIWQNLTAWSRATSSSTWDRRAGRRKCQKTTTELHLKKTKKETTDVDFWCLKPRNTQEWTKQIREKEEQWCWKHHLSQVLNHLNIEALRCVRLLTERECGLLKHCTHFCYCGLLLL